MRRYVPHLMLIIVLLIGLNPTGKAMSVARPSYAITTYSKDTVLVVLKAEDQGHAIYANLCRSLDHRRSEQCDSLFLTEKAWVTAWAEDTNANRSDTICFFVDPSSASTIGTIPPTGQNGPETDKIVALHFYEFYPSFFNYKDVSIAVNDKNNFWRLTSGGQEIAILPIQVSPFIGDDYGPADIYAHDISNNALLFGANNTPTQTPACVETLFRLRGPWRLSLNMTSDALQQQTEQVAVLISTDGVNYMSIDTLGTDQLKPIRRFSTLYEGNESVFIRIESTTRLTSTATLIFDIWITSKNTTTDIIELLSDKHILCVRYYDLLGRLLLTSKETIRPDTHAQPLIIQTEYTDGTFSTRKQW